MGCGGLRVGKVGTEQLFIPRSQNGKGRVMCPGRSRV